MKIITCLFSIGALLFISSCEHTEPFETTTTVTEETSVHQAAPTTMVETQTYRSN